MGVRGWLFGLLVLLLWAPSCITNHDALAKREGQGGQAGGSPARGGAGFGGAPVLDAGTGTGGSAGRPPDEPPGTNVLTIVHGVVDAEVVRLCLRAGRGESLRVLETPEGGEALGFGAPVVVRELEDLDPAVDDLQPLVIAGDLSLVQEMSCEDAIERARSERALAVAPMARQEAFAGAGGTHDGGASGQAAGAGGLPSQEPIGGAGGAREDGGAAGMGGAGNPIPDPPVLRLGELPVIPAGTLAAGRSWLFVANGCIGGPGIADELAEIACGDAYTPERPSLSAVLVPMSRQFRFDALGLQVVHASVSTRKVTVRSAPPAGGSDVPPLLVDQIGLGEILPRQARADRSRVSWGAGLPGWRLEVTQSGSVLYAEGWASVLERGRLEFLEDAKNYVVVLLGPRMDLGLAGFWNGPAITIVPSDP